MSTVENAAELPAAPEELSRRLPPEALVAIRETGAAHGVYVSPAGREGHVGITMFDTPTSEDDTILVLMHRDNIGKLPSQAAVRIVSEQDGRTYLGVVVRGPFALPDGLRADAPPVVATAIRGGFFLPEYHGLVVVEIAGEERGGQLQPHRFRPRPNSPVYALSEDEVRDFLNTGGEIHLGMAFGHENLEIAFPTTAKEALPRHTGILGTTGGGKSTTVANLVAQLQAAGVATILLDTEGEYTNIDAPTEDDRMIEALREQGREPAGVPNTDLYFLVGRNCANPQHPRRFAFSPRFANLSPYTALEIFDLNEAQEERFQKALTVTARLLDELKIWDEADHRFVKEEMDEFSEGYPKMRLSHLYDVARSIADLLQNKARSPHPPLKSPEFRDQAQTFDRLLEEAIKDEAKRWDSWRKVQGKLGRIERLNLFDNPQAPPLDYGKMLQPGKVSIIDLSDSDSTLVNNLIISDLLRGVQQAQDAAYLRAEGLGRPITPVAIIIEEAHEFLSAQRISKMPTLHQQVERIAKRGRKRWLGLVFVTQLPQHLPDAILGLINNFILHKIGDANVVARLKRSVGGVDEALWTRLPRLAPGQAVVSLASLSRPMLTAMAPAPCKLLMVR
ncbi:MAG TPA: ATP-binding protein [Chthonomonadaceae bacterium]|nr:ATP-binding protein [Chthonomonadaceae bacterium]